MKGLKYKLKQICKGLAIFILLLNLGAINNVSLARKIPRHYHIRTSHRIIKHTKRHRGAIRFRKRRTRHPRQLTNRQIKQDCSEVDRQTIKDVNRDRQLNHIPKLYLDHQLSKIGNQRSHQLQSYFSHNTKDHSNEIQYLLNHKNFNYECYGENIASSPLGTITVLEVGPYNTPTDANSRKLTYHAKNGYQLANNINNASMYHDAGDHNGHRDNDLDRQFKRMGVGVSYDHHDRNFYIAIEFIG